MPEHCEDHTRLVEDTGEIKATLKAQGERLRFIEATVKDIYDKINSNNQRDAYFKGRIAGGIAVIMGMAAIAGTVGAFIYKQIGGK